MNMRDYLSFEKSENKYDIANRMCQVIFGAIGVIVFIAVGLHYMNVKIWLLTLACCVLGAMICGKIASAFILMLRKDREQGEKNKTELLLKFLYFVIFAIATVAFVAIGIEEAGDDLKYWGIAFVGSYAGAVILSALARIIVIFTKKDN